MSARLVAAVVVAACVGVVALVVFLVRVRLGLTSSLDGSAMLALFAIAFALAAAGSRVDS